MMDLGSSRYVYVFIKLGLQRLCYVELLILENDTAVKGVGADRTT